MAGELPLFEAEPPHLEHALALRNLHPELQVVAVRFGSRDISANTETLAPLRRAVANHDVIISDRVGATIGESRLHSHVRGGTAQSCPRGKVSHLSWQGGEDEGKTEG